ncbi:MAG: Sec-independent protein translocase protein TatB [Candidatus Dichloromethanomonas elyunquensis]|nr:MAG: Sec-independent protein translocase protein TatB [Candidatus Dichloromethanomonas elyunquensis]
MGLTELVLILVVALILFGPEDLPVIARTLGKIFFQVRKYTEELTREFQDAINIPEKVINDALTESPAQTKALAEKNDDAEELLTYEDYPGDTPAKPMQEANPSADLPSDSVMKKDP